MIDNLRLFLLTILIYSCSSAKLKNRSVSDFIPENYVLYQQYDADLNNDGVEDCILIIKDTKKEQVVVNRFDKTVDRNRRGILVLFKKNNKYQLIDKNVDCFYSENEDGGNYYAPQLNVETDNGDIILNYEHGRYGGWKYRFRFINANYKLIEYHGIAGGAVTLSETSINFLTKEKVVKKNINEDDKGNNEVFKTTKTTIKIEQLIKLSEIKDFEELSFEKL